MSAIYKNQNQPVQTQSSQPNALPLSEPKRIADPRGVVDSAMTLADENMSNSELVAIMGATAQRSFVVSWIMRSSIQNSRVNVLQAYMPRCGVRLKFLDLCEL